MRPKKRPSSHRKPPEKPAQKLLRRLRWIENEMTTGNEVAKKKVKKVVSERATRRDDVVKKKEKLETMGKPTKKFERKPKTRISCPICYNEFNEIEGSEPVVLTCGHSICSKCVISIVEAASKRCDVRCPLDRITVGRGFLPFNLDVLAYNAR